MNEYNLILESLGNIRYFSKKSKWKGKSKVISCSILFCAAPKYQMTPGALPLTIWHKDTWHVSDQWISEYAWILCTVSLPLSTTIPSPRSPSSVWCQSMRPSVARVLSMRPFVRPTLCSVHSQLSYSHPIVNISMWSHILWIKNSNILTRS